MNSDADPNPYASANRWRHQESTAFAHHAAAAAATPPYAGGTSTDTGALADFLNQSRVEPTPGTSSSRHDGGPSHIPIPVVAGVAAAAAEASSPSPDGREIVCGPLLNYRRMEDTAWFGSVLVVVRGGGRGGDSKQPFVPTLVVTSVGDGAGAPPSSSPPREVRGNCLYSDRRNTFWQFDLEVQMDAGSTTTAWEYVFPGMRFANGNKPQRSRFFVPGASESMRIMFHSCNGFSVGTDEGAWSGPALWNDVLRHHAELPIHVMIGGGDQIYNDGIRVNGPLRPWTDIRSPKKRTAYPFPEKLRNECDEYYLGNYLRWYDTGAFAVANGQIPQINIWDDHDIIDGFGSYRDHFMKCDVFRGIGGTAHKYYMLFQHHLPPPQSTYTTDHPETMAIDGQGVDPNQLFDTYVAPAKSTNLSGYIVGQKPGPYVAEHSRSMYARLGARIAFLGIDARTERTRHQVNYPETYDLIFNRLRDELRAAAESGRPIRHLILLLGIPIAYPRLTWLENVLRSPVVGPIKFLNRRFGLGGTLFNHFDGSVDLLDDLDDHYTARTHKAERRQLMQRLQAVAAEFSVRITILGGDVHLAALGRFYSRPGLGVEAENDIRFMINVVSSAITNKPPPQAIANLLARRNKIHHLDGTTDETLLNFFDRDPGGGESAKKSKKNNHCTMPSRNYALLIENSPNNNNNSSNIVDTVGQHERLSVKVKDGHSALHKGEVGCGTGHKAAHPDSSRGRGNDGSLDVCIRVEIDQHDGAGHTQGYGLTVPVLDVETPTHGV